MSTFNTFHISSGTLDQVVDADSELSTAAQLTNH